MPGVRRWRVPSVGRVALLPAAAIAVHQLRYQLAYGSQAGLVLRETGHSYLHSVVPWLVALIGLAMGSFLLRAGRACTGRTSPRGFSLSFGALWLLCTVSLVAIFACQETLEGLFATGHPGGWAAVFGDGGWWAVPVAAGVGLVLAAVFHTARWAIRQLARRQRRPSRPRPVASVVRRPQSHLGPAPAALLAGWSNRGPPVWRSVAATPAAAAAASRDVDDVSAMRCPVCA